MNLLRLLSCSLLLLFVLLLPSSAGIPAGGSSNLILLGSGEDVTAPNTWSIVQNGVSVAGGSGLSGTASGWSVSPIFLSNNFYTATVTTPLSASGSYRLFINTLPYGCSTDSFTVFAPPGGTGTGGISPLDCTGGESGLYGPTPCAYFHAAQGFTSNIGGILKVILGVAMLLLAIWLGPKIGRQLLIFEAWKQRLAEQSKEQERMAKAVARREKRIKASNTHNETMRRISEKGARTRADRDYYKANEDKWIKKQVKWEREMDREYNRAAGYTGRETKEAALSRDRSAYERNVEESNRVRDEDRELEEGFAEYEKS